MRKNRLLIFIALTILLLATACQKDESVHHDEINNNDHNSIDETAYEKIVQANNDVGFKVIDSLAENADNVFISPVSLYMALSMVYPSALNETKVEMAEFLQIEGLSLDEIKEANASLYSTLQDEEADDISLHTANSMWIDDAFELEDDYARTIEETFHGQMSLIDASDASSVDKMNDWISEKTEGKINQAVEAPLADDFVAMLLNAVYFNGKWLHPFDEAATEDNTFYTAKDEENQVDFMQVQARLEYVETDDYEGVRLPYGQEGEMSMYAYLPKESGDLDSIHQAFLEERTEVVLSNMEEKKGRVALPKWELEYEQSMNDVLQQLGMSQAFDQHKAQFPNMITGDKALHISEVKHMTYLEVDEVGTEAAASTNVGIETTSAIVDEPFDMTFDHPFVIVIVDEATGTILFIGNIHEVS